MTAENPTPAPTQPRQAATLNLDRQMCVLRFSPCGNFLAAGGYDGFVRRWSIEGETLTELPRLSGHHGWVQALAFHPDRRRLYTADSWGELRVWPYADREPQPLHTVAAAHDGWARDLSVSADGRHVATCGMDRKVCLWSADGDRLRELTGHPDDVFCVAFHPDGGSLVSGDLQGNVNQWDVASGRRTRELDGGVLHTVSRLQDVGGVRRLAFDAAGQTLACAGTRPSTGGNVQGTPTVLLFDWASGQLRHTLTAGGSGDGFVYDLAFHPGGYVIAVASGNPGTGKFYCHRPGEQAPFFLHTRLANCHSLALHPDGRRVVVASTNTGSNGNGRQLRNGEYPGNFTPLTVWTIGQG